MKYGKMDRTCRTYYGEDKLLQNYSHETYRGDLVVGERAGLKLV